ncbi:Hypothetical protein POVR1_LOCUS552 [uncultured virus]|nr:Hypothetical protein POVR1_LOCUS552 [uncultured virus]
MTLSDVSALSQEKRYIGEIGKMYAIEDDFDQPICKIAHAKGIDIVTLTHMVGSHQVVTEILDTRDRSDSFKSLIYLT